MHSRKALHIARSRAINFAITNDKLQRINKNKKKGHHFVV